MQERLGDRRNRGAAIAGLFLLAWLLPGLARAAVAVDIVGASGDLRENIEAYVGTLQDDELASWRSTRTRLYENVKEALRSMGYYGAEVDIGLDRERVRIAITPGEPVRVRRLRLVFTGDADSDPAFAALRETLPVREGDILHHGRYEAMKTAVRNLGVERGYFDGEWETHAVAVDPEARSADIDLVYASGPRYRFGAIRFQKADGSEQDFLRPGLLRQFSTFKEGDPYDAGAVIKFNRALLDSRFFSEVRVQVERERSVDNAVPIDVVLAADKPNNMDVGIGYSTDVEERLTLKWQRPLINARGHGIEVGTELSPVRSSLDAKYTVPLTHPVNDNLQYLYGVRREEVEEIVTWNTVLGVQRQLRQENGWQRTYSLRGLRDTTELPGGEIKKDLVLPGVSFDRLRTKGGVDPHWGDRQFYQMEVASEDVLSDASLVWLRSGFRFLRTYAGRHQILLRADGGTVLTDNFDDVPQSMRFFAGGDQSVRGYSYRSLSPRDDNGIAIGARNLLTGTVEYDYEFVKRWRVAVFTDAGNAFDSASEPFKVGSGIGIRWVSPVGPIRLDVAWPVTETDKGLRVHFSMGPNL
ncbi:MAG: BamA/TamA family outer membrane protein [Moraxellaceae bacterium]|nr:BamA/TamA family outer membrane protein [Moraxellaceae bacterium]